MNKNKTPSKTPVKAATKHILTPGKRVLEFGKEVLVTRNNKLFCKFCNVELDVARKSSINNHIN